MSELKLRKELKAQRPVFKRHDSHKKHRASSVWRKPKGRHNKMRLNRKGYARGRSTGFSAPHAVRGLSTEGLTQNVIQRIEQFEGLDPKRDGIIISRTVGNRRRIELLKVAEEKKFKVLNIDAKRFAEQQKERESVKKQHKKSLADRRKEKAAAAKEAEKKSEDEKAEDAPSEEKPKESEDKPPAVAKKSESESSKKTPKVSKESDKSGDSA